jgi:hypothetical protein
MSALSGKNAKVMYGSVVVADMVEWSISGFTFPIVQKDTAFADTVQEYDIAEPGDPGTISWSGNYDPADTYGQLALQTVCEAGTTITNLYLYANTSTFWRVASGGHILVTKAMAITMPRNAYGKVTFEGKVSGAAMEQVGSGS